jgi:hypothetical protein
MRPATAVPIAIFALAMIALLVIGTSFVTRRLSADAHLAEQSAALAPVAEQAIIEAIAGWDSVARAAQPVGASSVLADGLADGGARTVSATRLSPSLYWVVGAASSGSPTVLKRRVGVLVTTRTGAPALVSGRAWGDLP